MKKSMGKKVRNHIPYDLGISILSNLPLKSLKRFGCVSKSWGILFENSNFLSVFSNNLISNHHSYYDDSSLLLQLTITKYDRSVYHSLYSLYGDSFINRVKLEWPNPFHLEKPHFYILDSGSINGNLCMYENVNGVCRIVIWNPNINELIVIPRSPVEFVPPPSEVYIVLLHGFGYDHIQDDYKIIRVIVIGNQYKDIPKAVYWEIYSLKRNSWKTLHMDMPPCGFDTTGERIYIFGMCHWIHRSSYINKDDPYLVSFNLNEEIFNTTLIPLFMDANLNHEYFSTQLVILNGSIATISWYDGTTTFYISILGELGVKESWINLFIVGPLSCVDRPIGIGKEGDIFFRKQDGELILFDLRKNVISELGIKGCYHSQIVILKESFLQIGGISL
ncbi:unnamed protein product [Lathyrus sativus]|nr:unnamed protein product [Lathyrus sativus]